MRLCATDRLQLAVCGGLFEPLPRSVLFAERDVVPQPASNERGEEAAGILACRSKRPLCRRDDLQPVRFASLHESRVSRVLKQPKRSCRFAEILHHDVFERGWPTGD